MKPEPLESIDESWGAQVPIADIGQANKIIAVVLVPDAIATLSKWLPEEESAVIEIRGKVCSYHYETIQLTHYGPPCPDDHKGRQMCGIAWLWFSGKGLDNMLPEEPLFDFDGVPKPVEAGIYYELARIKLELHP